MERIFVKDKHDEDWIFYINEQGELCYIKDGKEQILQGNIRRDFDIISGVGKGLHLTAQTDTGNLIYLDYDYNSWHKFTILESKSPEGVMSRFRLLEVGGVLHCFYILDFRGKSMAVHHIYDISVSPAPPKVIDYVSKHSEVAVCGDTDGNIHIFFTGVNGSMIYKIYSPKSGGYSEGKIDTEDEIKSIFPVCTEDNTIHFLYTAQLKSYYALVYLSAKAKERKIINFGDFNVTDMCMLINGNAIQIQWKERGGYYQCTSSDGGTTFQKPSSLNQRKGRPIEFIKTVSIKNPMGFGGNVCGAYYKNGEIEFVRGNKKEAVNHKSRDTAYNNSDGICKDSSLAERVARQEREIIRISTALKTLTDKVAYLSNGMISRPIPPQKSISSPAEGDAYTVESNSSDIKAFEDTNIEDVDFANSKKF